MNLSLTITRILIVEDDEATAELERRALVRSGMSVQIANGVKEALAALAAQSFDAILLDYNLPDGNPWTIVDAADLKSPRIPVIVVTAQGNELVASEALRHGVADYLKKSGTFWDQLPDAFDRVTRLARVEQALKSKSNELIQTNRRLEYIIESTSAGSWEWNVQTGATLFNERWCEIIGYKLKDLEPISVATWLEYLHPDDKSRSAELLQRHFTDQSEIYECEVRMRHRAGHWVWILSRGRIMTRTDDGQPEWMFGTHEEITQRVAEREVLKNLNVVLEQRVTERTAELESTLHSLHQSQEELTRSEAKAMLSMLAASVSHELNTPIGNSVLAATTLADLTRKIKRAMDAHTLKRAELVKIMLDMDAGATLIERNLKRAEDLLTSFRQVAADQSSERVRHFDLGATLQEIMDTLAPSLKRHPHRIIMTVPPGIMMDSEPGALGQIAINLINNAYLHAFEGRSDGVLHIDAQVDGEWVSLHFSDNGIGMSEETIKHLFQLFYSTKIGKGGTGLGMSIVKNLTKTLGGEIKVDSAPGRGTRYQIRLPLVLPVSDPDESGVG